MTTPGGRPAQRQPWSRVARARLGCLLGVLLVAAGVGYELGVGWGVAVLGAGIAAGFFLFYDVDADEDLPAEVNARGDDW